MSLIKSISGIRGTIGGEPGNNLTPVDLVNFLSAFAVQLHHQFPDLSTPAVVLGRDGRVSGPVLHDLSRSILQLSGLKVLDAGLATTPTIAMAVTKHQAQGGVILSASHNPRQWNALKLLNNQGEFITKDDGLELLQLAGESKFIYPEIDSLGRVESLPAALEEHLEAILKLKLVDATAIARRDFKIIVDGINSVGATAIPALLAALGVTKVEVINSEVNGEFAHNPEPLSEHLGAIKEQVKKSGADLGIVVDPDVDRLAFIDERGEMFGEEYTLVAVADYVLHDYCPCFYQKISVSNLSSSRALRDITEKRGGAYYATAVGELNVVAKMKEMGAVIGGEGNGGIIYPELHYGRDALVGTALFLSYLAQSAETASSLRQKLPVYEMVKDRLDLPAGADLSAILNLVKQAYAGEQITDVDGIKIDWSESWVHLRASNTEPIIRIYAEAASTEKARLIVDQVKTVVSSLIK